MRSVIEEKTSRIMEVMVSSVSPFQLMMGKVIGLGAAAFTAVAIWVVFGVALYLGSGAFAIPIDPSTSKLIFHPVVVVFFVLFLISGYLLYSTLFALVGSIVNTEKEAQNYVMPITISIILPVILGLSVVQEPNSALAMTLSFIPLFAPTMMMMRIVFVAPATTRFSPFSGILGESILAFLIVVLATVGIIWLTAKIFRIGILMYGKRPTLPELIKWLKY
jgi:ABC-2 type transport system permease protein